MSKRVVCPHGCGKEWTGDSNRRAKSPLDPDAVAAANQASAANCERLKQPDGSTREITMSGDDYSCRRVWMDAYLEAFDKKEEKEKKKKKKDPPVPEPDPEDPVVPCQQAFLTVHVTDFDGKPVEDAVINVDGAGGAFTDKSGVADYGEVPPGEYDISAEKENHHPAEDAAEGPAETTATVPACETTVVTLLLDPMEVILRENVIFIGSEEEYEMFWLKMMFIAAAYVEADGRQNFRSADKKTIAYVDHGYTRAEKLTLDFLGSKRSYNIVKVASGSDIVDYLNNRPDEVKKGRRERTLLQDVAFFCHGVPGTISLNYDADPDVDFTEDEVNAANQGIFVPDGRIYSYACRTGIGDNHWALDYDDDADAEPEKSLAQKMADRFQVEVHAFLRRTNYRQVLRDPADSEMIASTLKTARESAEGEIIQIPPEHEALPHEDLSDTRGGRSEGVNDYALWRKGGGRELPMAGDTPEGLSTNMRVFTPR